MVMTAPFILKNKKQNDVMQFVYRAEALR